MSVANTGQSILADLTLDFIFDENLLHVTEHDECPIKNGKFELGNIYGGKSRTFTVLFEPLPARRRRISVARSRIRS
jgi:hypothetical protein